MQGRVTRTDRPRLGDVLTRAGLLDAEGLARALERQRMQPGRLGSHLLALRLVGEEDLAKALSIQHRVPAFLPSLTPVEPGAVRMVPKDLARRRRALPVAWDPTRGVLQVALADPQDLGAVDEVRFASGARRVAVLVAPEHVIDREIARHYEGREPEPEIPDLPELAPVAPPGPRPSREPSLGRALVLDPAPRRRRAVAALLEAAGYRVVRAATQDEGRERAAEGGWSGIWAHQDWAADLPAEGLRVYRDPAREWSEALEAADPLLEEAEALARDALPEPSRRAAEEGVTLVRLLAARRGVGGWGIRWLALRAWRAALAGWRVPGEGREPPGHEVLRAVAAYQRALAEGGSRRDALARVTADPSVDPEVVTGLVRWAVGADLLDRLGGRPRLVALFRSGEAPEALLGRLRGVGWDVELREGPGDLEGIQAVLAGRDPGLALLESGRVPTGLPVFLLAPSDNQADTMYALRLGAEDVLAPDTHPDLVATKLERAAARQGARSRGVSGTLQEMGLADLVQTLSNGVRTAVIRVEGPEGAGEIALREGRIIDARCGDLVGEEALYRMVAWDEGVFRISGGVEPDRPRTVEGSTEGLLMEGFRRLDEARRDGSDDVPELG